MENKEAIEIIAKYHLSKYEHDKAYGNTKKYDRSINAFKTAIAALERQANSKGCAICNSDEIEKLLIMKERNEECLAFVGGNSKFPKENHAKFCPECGRKLEG